MRKGEIFALKTVTRAFYADHRPSTTSESYRLVEAVECSREGEARRYRRSEQSPHYRLGAGESGLSISKEQQAAARLLFTEGGFWGVEYDTAGALKDAIRTTGARLNVQESAQ